LLPTESRLKAKRDFQAVFSRRRSLADPLLALYSAPGRGKAARFGFSVGKKLGGAVRRNRVKRLLRESARQLLPEVAPDLDLIIVARVKAKDATLAELSASLNRLLSRANAKIHPKAE
jgi:ribonuclease P protein component